MKTIKIIDLLNKITNGEEIPMIEYNGMRTICYYLYDKCGEQCDDRELKNILNYEIEIIEEEKKLPEKLEKYYNYLDDGSNSGHYFENILKLSEHGESEITEAESLMIDKINEIIDYLESKEKGE